MESLPSDHWRRPGRKDRFGFRVSRVFRASRVSRASGFLRFRSRLYRVHF